MGTVTVQELTALLLVCTPRIPLWRQNHWIIKPTDANHREQYHRRPSEGNPPRASAAPRKTDKETSGVNVGFSNAAVAFFFPPFKFPKFEFTSGLRSLHNLSPQKNKSPIWDYHQTETCCADRLTHPNIRMHHVTCSHSRSFSERPRWSWNSAFEGQKSLEKVHLCIQHRESIRIRVKAWTHAHKHTRRSSE